MSDRVAVRNGCQSMSSPGGEKGDKTVALPIRRAAAFIGFAAIAVAGALFSRVGGVSPQPALPVAKVNRPMGKLRRVLVPILKENLSEHAVELACRVGHDECAELILVHVVIVPYAFCLDTPLPEQDKIAQREFQVGCQIAKRYGCPARVRIVHQRHPGEGVLQVAREEKVDAIVLGVGAEERVPGEWEHTITDVLRRAECEVIIDRVPLAA